MDHYGPENEAIALAKGFVLHHTGGGLMSFAKFARRVGAQCSVFFDESEGAWAAGAYDWENDVFADDQTNFLSLEAALERAAYLLTTLDSAEAEFCKEGL